MPKSQMRRLKTWLSGLVLLIISGGFTIALAAELSR